MFVRNKDRDSRKMLPGVELKTLVHGDVTLLAEFRLKKGSSIPSHSHPQEQTGYLVRGKIRLEIGDETFDVEPGDGWCVKGGESHGAEAVEDSLVVEIFSPPREDYLS